MVVVCAWGRRGGRGKSIQKWSRHQEPHFFFTRGKRVHLLTHKGISTILADGRTDSTNSLMNDALRCITAGDCMQPAPHIRKHQNK